MSTTGGSEHSGRQAAEQERGGDPDVPVEEAGAEEVSEALRSALLRTEANFINAVNGRPVRDMAETLAENRAALAEAGSGRISDKNKKDDLLKTPWQAAPETTIGGWCVQPQGESPTHEGGIELACFMSEGHAQHIADLHNQWLESMNG